MSFFSRFHKAGTTAITQQDIKVKTVKVPSTPTTPHPLPIIAHQRPATPRTPSFNIAPSATTSTKPKSSSKSGLLSPPATGDRGRDSKIGRDRSTSRADISRDRSLKRKESSSSFQRNDSPSTTTSSLRSVSPSTDSVTSHPKKRKLTPSATHRNSPIQEKLFSSDDESESGSDDEASEGSKEEKLRRLREAEELGLTKRDRDILLLSLLTPKQRIPITAEDPTADGILRLIRRSIRKQEPELLATAVEKYNKLVRMYRKNGVFQKNIEKLGKTGAGIPLDFSEHILTQSYARSVALEVDSLRKYEAFSNNVYGELLPRFTSKLFKEAKLRPDQVFVDLGSGTGNVVLHAALEVGCESWGCEMMEKACELADAQAREFDSRCTLWGLKPGKVRLEKGDFLENEAIAGVLKRADVLLVNNYAFDSTLNARLIDMFLDLKEGTQIISLKSFVPPNHAITPRNVDSPVNLLRVEEKEYFSGCVSWTNAPGRYYVSTVDRSMLRNFLEANGAA